MELQAISGAATVALTSTIVFLLIAKTWQVISRTVGSPSSFSNRIMLEAAQQFRDELDRISSTQSIYLSGILVFLLLYVAAYVLQAKQLFIGYPAWRLYLHLAFLLLVLGFAIFHLAKTVLARRQVKFLRDANIAIGHQLQQLPAEGTRVFHDVKTAAGIVDHVIISRNGVYAVNVIARPSAKQARAKLHANSIVYSDSKIDHSIVHIYAKTARLQKEFCKLLGHKVRVRSVIAIPGWKIDEQPDNGLLLVNEQTIAMLSGWKDKSDFLMNEDASALQSELTSRCARSQVGRQGISD